MPLEHKQFQFPKCSRNASNGTAMVFTYVGKEKHEEIARVSPRINDELKEKVLNNLEAKLKAKVQSLQPA